VHQVARLVDRRCHDLGEQPLLVGEVGVHRLFGDPGPGRDLVHAGAEIAVTEEDRSRGIEDGPVFADPATVFLGPTDDFRAATPSEY
jgi:hypothetical protein